MSSTQARAGRHNNRSRAAAPTASPAHDQESRADTQPTPPAGGTADPPVWWDEWLSTLDFYGGPLGCVWEPPSPPMAAADEDDVDEPEEVEDEEDVEDEGEEDEDELVDEDEEEENEDDEEDEDDLDDEEEAEEDEELEAEGDER